MMWFDLCGKRAAHACQAAFWTTKKPFIPHTRDERPTFRGTTLIFAQSKHSFGRNAATAPRPTCYALSRVLKSELHGCAARAGFQPCPALSARRCTGYSLYHRICLTIISHGFFIFKPFSKYFLPVPRRQDIWIVHTVHIKALPRGYFFKIRHCIQKGEWI